MSFSEFFVFRFDKTGSVAHTAHRPGEGTDGESPEASWAYLRLRGVQDSHANDLAGVAG
jgi:hypothetical protein